MPSLRRTIVALAMFLLFKNDLLDLLAAKYGPTETIVFFMDLSEHIDVYVHMALTTLGNLVKASCNPLAHLEVVLDHGIPSVAAFIEQNAPPYLGDSVAESILPFLKDTEDVLLGVYKFATWFCRISNHLYTVITLPLRLVDMHMGTRLLSIAQAACAFIIVLVMASFTAFVSLTVARVWRLVNKGLHWILQIILFFFQ